MRNDERSLLTSMMMNKLLLLPLMITTMKPLPPPQMSTEIKSMVLTMIKIVLQQKSSDSCYLSKYVTVDKNDEAMKLLLISSKKGPNSVTMLMAIGSVLHSKPLGGEMTTTQQFMSYRNTWRNVQYLIFVFTFDCSH